MHQSIFSYYPSTFKPEKQQWIREKRADTTGHKITSYKLLKNWYEAEFLSSKSLRRGEKPIDRNLG